MAYSLDLRTRVVEWVEKGGSVSRASKIYQVGRATIYRWMSRADLRPTKVKRRKRKLDWEALAKDIEENPDSKLATRAEKFGVRPSAICYALKAMKTTRKKKNYAIEKEIEKRELHTIDS
jgi:putative transposase